MRRGRPVSYGRHMSLSIAMVTLDCREPVALATWWAQLLGSEVGETNDGWFVLVSDGSGRPRLGFQKVDDPTPGKNKMHLDLHADDLEAEVARLLAAGATEVGRRSIGEFGWVTLADPEGNEFCVAPA